MTLVRSHIPPDPAFPGEPRRPGWPGTPFSPNVPSPNVPSPNVPPSQAPVPPTRVWLDPHADYQGRLAERLLERRIVLASGILDEDAATRLSAQLLTLDAEGDEPIRLEMQNLRAELASAITLMGVLDVMRVEVHAYASGEIAGPALGVLVSCPRRLGYPNASFTLTEPRVDVGGTFTASALSAREQQLRRMLDTLIYRLAEVTGREADDIREDAKRGRSLTAAEAIGYGLLTDRAAPRPA
jgi:ATP-dependent Clp protease, protease subunit